MSPAFNISNSFSRRRRARRDGFTIVELLVVIGIITVLISILLPALTKAREAGKATVCQSNQRQLMMAFLMFAAEHDDRLPGNYWDSMYQQPDYPERRDWLLGDNPGQGNYAQQVADGPEKGTIFKYVNNNYGVYLCPSYEDDRVNAGGGSNGKFDYAAFIVFSGAKLTHIRMDAARFQYNSGPFAGQYANDVFVPIICEEEPNGGINGGNDEGGHCNSDRIGHYHNGGGFYATIDGSVHWFKEPLDCNSWNWQAIAPSGNWSSLGPVPIPGWGWWDKQ